MGLLFLNALKGLKNHKLQMISIIILLALSTGIYTTMNTALDRIEDRYYSYLEEQNVEDFSFVPSNYSIDEKNTSKMDKIAKKYNFNYELTSSKMTKTDDVIIKAMPYNNTKKINVPYLVEGNFSKNNNEITILKGFAKANNLKIGDNYIINKQEYKIVGYVYASDYIYPMLSINIPIFDEKKNNIIFMTQEEYNNFLGIEEQIYVGKFNEKTDPRKRMEIEIKVDSETGELIPITNNPATTLFVEEKETITRDMNTIFRTVRIDSMQLELETDRVFAEYFLYLLLSISVIIIIIINKKRIEDERLQIGVLKSLGYRKSAIAISYLVYPIIGSLIGGLIGYFSGYYLNDILAQVYLSYFNIVLTESSINFNYLLQCIFIPLISLSILSFLVSLLMLRKKPLELLREGSNLKVNFLTKLTNLITRKMKFEKRFRYSLAFRSIGKLLIVSLTSFATGLLITLTLIGSSLFSNVIDQSFEGLNFDYMVSYINLKEEKTDKEDYILQVSAEVIGIVDSSNKEKEKKEEEFIISLNGIDSKLNYMDIKDKEKNNLLNLLTDQTIIINENVKELLQVDVGDYLILSINDKELKYEIVGIENTYKNISGYTKRNKLSEALGSSVSVYNLKYSNDKKYSNISNLDLEEVNEIGVIFNFDDLKRNISSQMDVYNSSLYVVIAFAAVMALIIITVIANIIVEENKKTISLMKVMGYKNKEVSRIVLNIYTPFIIISYLLSIPVMKKILESIIKVIANDIDMTIPININIYQIIIGLVSLLVAYFIAIAISKKTLNKIPLSIALKRE